MCSIVSTKMFDFQVFGKDFTLCLLLGNFLSDPILAHSGDLKVSVYGPSAHFRSRRLSSMYLQIAEGHVLGQVGENTSQSDKTF